MWEYGIIWRIIYYIYYFRIYSRALGENKTLLICRMSQEFYIKSPGYSRVFKSLGIISLYFVSSLEPSIKWRAGSIQYFPGKWMRTFHFHDVDAIRCSILTALAPSSQRKSLSSMALFRSLCFSLSLLIIIHLLPVLHLDSTRVHKCLSGSINRLWP